MPPSWLGATATVRLSARWRSLRWPPVVGLGSAGYSSYYAGVELTVTGGVQGAHLCSCRQRRSAGPSLPSSAASCRLFTMQQRGLAMSVMCSE